MRVVVAPTVDTEIEGVPMVFMLKSLFEEGTQS